MSIFNQYFLSSFSLILSLCFSSEVSATAVTKTYIPTSYTTLSGADGGQPVQNLQNVSAIGMESSAPLVEFKGSYNGYRSYFIPSDSNVTAIQVFANFKTINTNQTWVWQIFDWVYNGWVKIGTNAMALDQGPWVVLNFNVGGQSANYVNAQTGEIRIGFTSGNSADNALLNYEAVAVTTDPLAPKITTTYFVAPTGADSNPGTFSSPWKTISHAAQVATAGSIVYVRAGTYTERIVFQVSGTAEKGPITFMSYPGELAVIDGTNVQLPEPSERGPSGLLQLTNVNYLTIQGFEIKNIASTLNFIGGIAIEGQCDHIQIRHSHIHTLSGNKADGHGISAYGTSSPKGITNLIIDGNELENLELGQSESLVVNGNVQYWTISNNIIHDNNNIGIDAIGAEGVAPAAYDQARDGTITGNLVYKIDNNNNPTYPKNDNSADGIYVDGGASILISGNILHHNNIGIEVASEQKGHNSTSVIVSNNLVFLNTGAGISIGGYGKTKGGVDKCSIVNNTLFSNDTQMTGSGELQLQYFPPGVSNNIAENNIFYAGKQGLLISNPIPSPLVSLDYNIYYTPNGKSAKWLWNNKSYRIFAKYQTASGNDAHSLFADPQFVNTTFPILYVLSSSPAIDAGKDLGQSVQGTVDVSGHPRVKNGKIDIGAYEQ